MVRRPRQERGLARFNALLDAAHALLTERDLDDIGLYQIAERAGVPPASAYHFFPAPNAVFLALAERYHESFAEVTLELDWPVDGRWQTLLEGRIDAAVLSFNASLPMRKLLLGSHANRELLQSEASFNESMAQRLVEAHERYFHMPVIRDAQRKYLVMLTLVDAVWGLSFMQHGTITPQYRDEALKVAVAYGRTFLPEHLERRESSSLPI